MDICNSLSDAKKRERRYVTENPVLAQLPDFLKQYYSTIATVGS
jgi:hypothetical protein